MLFKTLGDKKNPVVLFFHAMGVTGEQRACGALFAGQIFLCASDIICLL